MLTIEYNFYIEHEFIVFTSNIQCMQPHSIIKLSLRIRGFTKNNCISRILKAQKRIILLMVYREFHEQGLFMILTIHSDWHYVIC